MKKYFSLPDIKLLVAIFILLAFSLSMIYSSSISISLKIYNDRYHIFVKQLIWTFTGIIFLLLFINFDYTLLKKYARIFILVAIIFLILVLIPGIGVSVKNSRSWINFKFFNFQPAEFAKFALIVYLSYIFSKRKEKEEPDNFFETYLPPLIIISLIFFLILLQPDFGTAFLIMAIAITLTFISGIKTVYIINTTIFILPIIYFLIFKIEYRKMRLLTFLNPLSDPIDKGYQILQSIKCFKIGGLTGVGIGKGIQKLYYLPQPHTDFIFSVIAEEVGLIGILGVILCYVYIILRLIRIALRVSDKFAFFFTCGTVIMISYQALINFFVSTGLMPVTGLPAPLLSYGGSALIVNMMALGVALNISRTIEHTKTSEVLYQNEE